MKEKIFWIIFTLSNFMMISSITAQQQNESNYLTINESKNYPVINESNYYLPVQDSKNETASQANESANFTISSTVGFAEELIGEKSYETVQLKDEKVIAVETTNKKINIEPILKKILDSGYHPSNAVLIIAGKEEQYKVPPGVNDTILIKIYVSNKSREGLYSELSTLGAKSPKYYPTEKLIKARVPIAKRI